jgi:phosphoglycerate dehydrogenase-like enzyme
MIDATWTRAAVKAAAFRISKSSAQAAAIAEYVMCHALSVLHPTSEARALKQARSWQTLPFREIASTRWVIVGFGSIGQEPVTG